MIDNNFNFSTLCKPFESDEELKDINKVKVQLSEDKKAVAFSKSRWETYQSNKTFITLGYMDILLVCLRIFRASKQTMKKRET